MSNQEIDLLLLQAIGLLDHFHDLTQKSISQLLAKESNV